MVGSKDYDLPIVTAEMASKDMVSRIKSMDKDRQVTPSLNYGSDRNLKFKEYFGNSLDPTEK